MLKKFYYKILKATNIIANLYVNIISTTSVHSMHR